MKLIDISTPKYPNTFTKVSDCDFDRLSKFKWCVNRGYVVRHETAGEYIGRKRKMVKMHRAVMNTPENLETDHINRDTLDNQRENLRVVNAHQNQRNTKTSVKNTSGFKGVYWDKKYKKWCARITFYGKRIFGGGYKDIVDAANAYERLIQTYG